jgi:hypothetical protein
MHSRMSEMQFLNIIVEWVLNTQASLSRSPGLESWHGEGYRNMLFFVFFLTPAKQIPILYLKTGHGHFFQLVMSNQGIIK